MKKQVNLRNIEMVFHCGLGSRETRPTPLLPYPLQVCLHPIVNKHEDGLVQHVSVKELLSSTELGNQYNGSPRISGLDQQRSDPFGRHLNPLIILSHPFYIYIQSKGGYGVPYRPNGFAMGSRSSLGGEELRRWPVTEVGVSSRLDLATKPCGDSSSGLTVDEMARVSLGVVEQLLGPVGGRWMQRWLCVGGWRSCYDDERRCFNGSAPRVLTVLQIWSVGDADVDLAIFAAVRSRRSGTVPRWGLRSTTERDCVALEEGGSVRRSSCPGASCRRRGGPCRGCGFRFEKP